MSTETKTGGPAFPLPFIYDPERGACGLYVDAQNAGAATGVTVRDYIAIRAMRSQPLFPSNIWQALRWAIGLTYNPASFSPEEDAKIAYRHADAMIKERAKP